MKKIKLGKLNNIVIKEIDEDYFIGFNVTKHTDVNGVTYELKDMEEKYYFLTKFGENKLKQKQLDSGDGKETYTTGYRNGHTNGQMELLEKILDIDVGLHSEGK